jgi:hypothetical protein
MPRDSAGTYSSPSGPFIAGTPVASSVMNAKLADLGSEVGDALSRSGKGGMAAPLVFTGITATVQGGAANGASAVGVILDNTAALTTAGAKTASFRHAGTEKGAIDKDGNVLAPEFRPLVVGAATVKGTGSDGAGAVGVVLDNAANLTSPTAKAASIRTGGIEKAYFTGAGTLFMGGVQAASHAALDDTAGKVYRLEADAATSTGAFVDLSGLAFPAAANTDYDVEAVFIAISSAPTRGIGLQLTGPAAPTRVALVYETQYTTSPYVGVLSINAFSSAAQPADSANVVHINRLRGIIRNGANAGTVQLQFKSEDAAGSVTLYAGSFLRVRKLT